MPGLLDLFGGGFVPMNAQGAQAPMGFMDNLAQNRNSLIGLGLGLMGGTRDDPMGPALRGYQAGAANDQNALYRQYMMKKAAEDKAYRERQDRLSQSNWERNFSLEKEKAEQPRLVGSAETGYYLVDRKGNPVTPGAVPSEAGGPQPIIPPKAKAPKDLTAADRKAIFEAEDEGPALQGTVESLQRAKELNSSIFEGYGAGARASIGSKLPDWMVPDTLADKKTAEKTLEWQKVMTPEAIKQMAATLKGATTDFELSTFVAQLADPTTPAPVREKIIERMQLLAQRKAKINQTRMDQLRGGTYYKPGGGQSSEGPDPLAEAKAAIAAGADPNKVKQRLLQNGINPSGL